jgi:hypothetical protein
MALLANILRRARYGIAKRANQRNADLIPIQKHSNVGWVERSETRHNRSCTSCAESQDTESMDGMDAAFYDMMRRGERKTFTAARQGGQKRRVAHAVADPANLEVCFHPRNFRFA